MTIYLTERQLSVKSNDQGKLDSIHKAGDFSQNRTWSYKMIGIGKYYFLLREETINYEDTLIMMTINI